MTGTQRAARRAVGLLMAAAVCALVAPLVGPLVGDAGAQESERSVQVEVSAGFDGSVGHTSAFPVSIEMTSSRARRVEVDVLVEGERRTYSVELVAGAPVELEMVGRVPPFGLTSFRVVAEVRDGGRLLGSGDTEVVPTPGRALVGVGASLPPPGDDAVHRTVGGVQEVELVVLGPGVWGRPGALESLSTVVLGPADLDEVERTALDDVEGGALEQLRTWVWRGGELVLDVERRDPLPVIGLDAAAGARSAVGAGWVRFTGGRAGAGPWGSVLEASVARQPSDQVPVFWGAQDRFGMLQLVDIEFVPVPVVFVAVFGTALLVGPGLWVLLRTRGRRRWMWVASPVLSLGIAALLLVLGQSVFTSAEARASASVEVDPWSASGEAVFGLKESRSLTVGPTVEVVGASPAATVEDVGEGRRVEVTLPRNGFGYLGVSPVAFDRAPLIEVRAVASGDDQVDVTVTNGSESDLEDVWVRTATRARPFEDVPAGGSVTLPFLVGAEVGPFSTMFPADQPMDVGWDVVAPGVSRPLPLSRGLVVVSGTTRGTVEAAGLSARGDLSVLAMAPVTGDGADHTTLRIESVGEVSRPDPNGGESEEAERTFHLRITAPGGRPAGTCGIHTIVDDVELWDGDSWVDAPPQGEPYDSPRLLSPNEVQARRLPAIEPGGAVLLRLTSRFFLEAPLMVDCGDRP